MRARPAARAASGLTPVVLTIGHSNHPYAKFRDLLQSAGATAIIDIRSAPYSRWLPHFNTRRLQDQLPRDGIEYHYLGRELGGRPTDPRLYRTGRADYERMAATAEFRQGLERVAALAQLQTPALLCSERDPLDCHRCLLVGRALRERGLSVSHVLAEGRMVAQQGIEEHLLELVGGAGDELFATTREERLAAAYRLRADHVAFPHPALKQQRRSRR